MAKELFRNDTASLFLDEAVPCIVYKIERLPSSSEALREGSRNLIRVSEKLQLKGILLDARGSMGVLTEDVEWNTTYVTPRLIHAGIKKIAIIGIDNDLVKVSVEEYMELTANAPLHQFIFPTEDEAKAWLSEEVI